MKIALFVAGLLSVAGAVDCPTCCISDSTNADNFCKDVEDGDLDLCAGHSCDASDMCCSLDGSGNPNTFMCCVYGCTPCTFAAGETDCMALVGQKNKCASAPTPAPTAEPTVLTTPEPTVEPTAEPTAEPTVEPTAEPSIGDKLIESAGDCCRRNKAQTGKMNKMTDASQCVAGCDEVGCTHYSFSAHYKVCVLCSKCDLTTKGNAQKYVSYERIRAPTTAVEADVDEAKVVVENLSNAGDCCRNNGANIGYEKGVTVADQCIAGCDKVMCTHFSHSVKYEVCQFCSKCDLNTKHRSAKKYTSWERTRGAQAAMRAVQPSEDSEDSGTGAFAALSWIWGK